jgi:hypothetical protein
VAGPWRPSFGGKPAAGAEIDRAGCALVAGLRAQRTTDHGREQQRRNGRCDRDDEHPCATEFTHASHASAAPPGLMDAAAAEAAIGAVLGPVCLCFWSRRMNGAAIALAGTLRQFINSMQLLADEVFA